MVSLLSERSRAVASVLARTNPDRFRMKVLSHHKYSSPFRPDYLSGQLEFWTGDFVDAIRNGRGAFATVPGSLLRDAGLSYFEKKLSDVRRFLDLGAEVGAIACAVSFCSGDVSVVYGGSTIVAAGSVPTLAVSPSGWIRNCFDTALLARRRDLVEVVLGYPDDYLRRADGERDEYNSTLVETLRAFVRGQPDWKDLAVETERNLEPDRAVIAPANWIAMERARIGILRAIDQGTTEALDAALVTMIATHKACLGRGQEAKDPGSSSRCPLLRDRQVLRTLPPRRDEVVRISGVQALQKCAEEVLEGAR